MTTALTLLSRTDVAASARQLGWDDAQVTLTLGDPNTHGLTGSDARAAYWRGFARCRAGVTLYPTCTTCRSEHATGDTC